MSGRKRKAASLSATYLGSSVYLPNATIRLPDRSVWLISKQMVLSINCSALCNGMTTNSLFIFSWLP